MHKQDIIFLSSKTSESKETSGTLVVVLVGLVLEGLWSGGSGESDRSGGSGKSSGFGGPDDVLCREYCFQSLMSISEPRIGLVSYLTVRIVAMTMIGRRSMERRIGKRTTDGEAGDNQSVDQSVYTLKPFTK